MPWFLAGLIYAGLYVGTAILSAILNRNAGRESEPGQPSFPKADPAAPIPVVFGTTRVGMNVIHKANVTLGENTVRNGALSFGWSSTKVGDFYYLDLAAVLCHGPVGALHDIIVDGTKKLSTTASARVPLLDAFGVSYTTTQVVQVTGALPGPAFPLYTTTSGAKGLTITAGELLGGKLSRGGIGAGGDTGSTGQMIFYPGTGWNEQNARLETLAGQDLPTYPDLCWVAFGPDFYFGNGPELPSIEFVVTRAPQAPFLGTGLVGNVTANAGADASAAGVLWEILTNPTWGLGLPASVLDQGSFSALDAACNAGLGEDAGLFLGLSFVLDTQASAKQLLTDVLRTLDGVLYTDPETGLICVRLLQHATSSTYGVGTNAYTLDASVIRSVEWTESAPDAQANEVKVEFADRARDYTTNTVTVRNVAAIQALGRVESRTVTFVGVQDADIATRLGMRELRTLSTTVGKATIDCDRTGYRLTPGAFFYLDWTVAGKSSRLMRCLTQRDEPNGRCVIEAVEDVYSTPPTTYAVETTPEPTPVAAYPTLAPYGYLETSVSGTATGTATLFLYDPSGAVTLVEHQTTSGTATPSGWVADTYPYTATVTRNQYAPSTIEFRVTYTDAAGATQTLTFTATFDADADTLTDTIGTGSAAGAVLGGIGVKEVFVRVPEDDQWLALSTIPASETEIGTEYRTKRYLVGMGSVRLNANIKALTGTPTLKLKFSTDAFGSVADVMTWAPSGTGPQSSGFVAVPSGARVDAGLTLYIADGGGTAALDLYALDAEFIPTTVAGARVHAAEFAQEFY